MNDLSNDSTPTTVQAAEDLAFSRSDQGSGGGGPCALPLRLHLREARHAIPYRGVNGNSLAKPSIWGIRILVFMNVKATVTA